MNAEYFVTVDLKSSGQGIQVAGVTLSVQQIAATTFLTGPDGLSAYQVWLNNGNTGSESDFIASLKGDPATNLVQSVNGKQGVVVLSHTDVGADEAGSAATAEANANTYTDTETAAAILESKGYTDDELQALATAIGAQLAAKADLVGGLVPASQLPSYVDDVLSYPNLAAFPATGESGKIYLAEDTNVIYRWSGSAYVEISASLALGETASTAFPGNRGKAVEDALPGKVDKKSTINTAYIVDGTGNQVNQALRASDFSAWSVVQRNASGQILAADATVANGVTNKQQMEAADALKVSKAGDTMTGRLNIANSAAQTAFAQTRAGNVIAHGATATGNFNVTNETTSTEMLNVLTDGTGVYLGSSTQPRIVHGTGMPNGVISAPVGSTYIDKNATNGAIEWKKATGTGNTGWVVSVGDTGYRILVAWDAAGTITTGSMPPNMTPKAGRAGDIRLRRKGDEIELYIREAVFTAGTVNIPNFAGFRSAAPYYPQVPMFTTAAISAQCGSAYFFLQAVSGTLPNDYGASAKFEVTSAWPTTLPGTPA